MTYNTGDNLFGVSNYIVSATPGLGNYLTIQSAVTAASVAGFTGTVFIKEGTYTEDVALSPGINLAAFSTNGSLNGSGQVIISGNMTFSSAGDVSLYGLELQTNSNYVLSLSGSAVSIVNLENCFLNCTNHTGINYTSSSVSSIINLTNCYGTLRTTGIAFFTSSSAGTMNVSSCVFTNVGNSTTANTVSAGVFFMNYSIVYNPFSISGTCLLAGDHNRIDASATNTTALSVTASGNCGMGYSLFFSGSASAISIGTGSTFNASHIEVNSTNTNAIAGSGSIQDGGTIFSGSSSTMVNTLTRIQNPTSSIIQLASGPYLTFGSGSPSGVVTAPQGSLYLNITGNSTSTRAFINTNGSTGWTNIVTAA